MTQTAHARTTLPTADPNSTFSHSVLMRFNVRTKHAAEKRDAAIRNRKDWLETRFALFEEFCWPTLKAQSSKNFRLYVFFDQETPSAYLKRFDDLTRSEVFVVRVLCDFFDSDFARRAVLSDLAAGCPWILTTRLDNDDGLHSDFIKTVQNSVRLGVVEATNLPQGLVLTNRALYASHQPSNAFISLLERTESCRTVLQVSHNEMIRQAPIREIVTEPMWFQHVHGGNVSNKIRGKRIPFSRLPKGFDVLQIEKRMRKVSQVQAAAENLSLGLVRTVRDHLARTARQLRAVANHIGP